MARLSRKIKNVEQQIVLSGDFTSACAETLCGTGVTEMRGVWRLCSLKPKDPRFQARRRADDIQNSSKVDI